MPWSRDLGGSRVQVELADEWSALGCEITKFDCTDAFPWLAPLSRFSRRFAMLASLCGPSFASRARAFVRSHAGEFDIIDCHQGNLPYAKSDLGFTGLLVARSVGLYAFYSEYARAEAEKASTTPAPSGGLAGRIHRWLLNRQNRDADEQYAQSLQVADVINLPNDDERRYVAEVLGLGEKCTVQPFGLSKQRLAAFERAQGPAAERLAAKEVVFIGAWSSRKGSRDWAGIVAKVRLAVPAARFKFLGTGTSPEKVLADLRQTPCDWIEIIPQYASDDLPALLADSTVGAFPSYIEGFGFAVLEKLAAGLPTVAYDVPGPRAMLCEGAPLVLVPRGDLRAFAGAICAKLSLPEDKYRVSSMAALHRSHHFSWTAIARETLDFYEGARDTVRSRQFSSNPR